jgi:hypothetical protein
MRYPIWYTEVYSDLLVRTLWYTVPYRAHWMVHSYRSRGILGTYLGTQWYTGRTYWTCPETDNLLRGSDLFRLVRNSCFVASQVRNSGATLRIPSAPFAGICTDTFGAVRRIPSTPSVKRSVPRYTSRITVPLSVST